MSFSYRSGTIGAAVDRLDDLQGWAGEGRAYAANHLGLSFADAGVLNQLAGTAGKVDTNTTAYLRDLRDLVGDVRGALKETARTYRAVDDERAERLDKLAKELEPGELGRTKALTEESQYVMYESSGWFDPSVRLTDPEGDPDVGGPSWWDLLSPTAMVNDAIYAVTKFAATIGLMDHPVNVVEEICKPISGDWNAFSRAGQALENLGGFVFETRYCFRTIAADLGDGWRGHASANARTYLYDVASDLTISAEVLTKAGQNYADAADAAKTFADVLSSLFEAITDTAVAAAVAVAATGGASATGIGLPVALITGGYALSRVKKVVDAVKDMLKALDDFRSVVDGVESTLGGLGVVSGYLPLQPIGTTSPPSVQR